MEFEPKLADFSGSQQEWDDLASLAEQTQTEELARLKSLTVGTYTVSREATDYDDVPADEAINRPLDGRLVTVAGSAAMRGGQVFALGAEDFIRTSLA